MLVIRLQRTGRKKLANFRIVVQDSRRTPSSGKVAAYLGSYDPHTKKLILDKEKAEFYLKNGAQPSERVVSLLKNEKIALPAWVKEPVKKEKNVRNPEKRRSTAPKESKDEAPEIKEDQIEQEPQAEDKEADKKDEAQDQTENKEALENEA